VKIVCLGDSTTAGTPYFESPIEAPPDGRGDETGSFPYWLRQRHPEWTILNRGVNGERSDQMAARFDRDVLAFAPDAVVIIAGVNDVYQGRPVDHVTGRLEAMYRRGLDHGLVVVAGTIVPYNTATPAQNAAMRDINRWIATRVASNPKMRFVDTRAAAAAPDDPDKLSGSPDGLHPDRDGYRRMADAIDRVIGAKTSGVTPEVLPPS
jgi:lysophospholipase L1-like esterase